MQPETFTSTKSIKLYCPIMHGEECCGHECALAICQKALTESSKDVWYCGLIATKTGIRHRIDITNPTERPRLI